MTERELLETLLDSVRRNISVARVVIAEGEGEGRWALVRDHDAPGWEALGLTEGAEREARLALRDRRHATITADGRQLWVEVLGAPPTLLIVGAGHLAQPLVTLGKLCDFKVAVMDDRPQYANRQRFPEADEVIAAPFREALREFALGPDTYIVLVTRGHAHDVACLEEVINRPHAYLGMVGSKRRVRAVWSLLEREKGLPASLLGKVFSPIGLDIGAESPAEIAVSIMAEIFLVRRGGTGTPLSDALAERGGRVHVGRVQQGSKS